MGNKSAQESVELSESQFMVPRLGFQKTKTNKMLFMFLRCSWQRSPVQGVISLSENDQYLCSNRLNTARG